MDMYLCSVGIAFGHWPGTVDMTSVKEKKKHHLRLGAASCFMCRPSVCQCVSCLHVWFYSHIRDVANQHQTLREKELRPLPLAGLPHMENVKAWFHMREVEVEQQAEAAQNIFSARGSDSCCCHGTFAVEKGHG